MRHIILMLSFLALMAASAGAAELKVSAPDSIEAGASIPVRIESGIEKGDQVTIGTADGKPIPNAKSAYPTTSELGANLAAPVEPGDYTVVVLRANAQVAAKPIKVMPPSATVEAPDQAFMRQELDVRYVGPANPGDHLTYLEGDGSRVLYAPRAYLKDQAKGSLKIQAPEKPGEYQVAYITGGKVLASRPIRIAGASASLIAPARVRLRETFEVRVEGPANAGDFLILGDAKGAPLALAAKVPLRGKRQDTLRMKAPQQEGDFTVVYQSGETVLGSAPLKAERPKAPK